MSKALEYTVKLVSERLSNAIHHADKEHGQKVAEYFEEIYNKISEIEKKESE